jgi:hypothetical protein
MCTKLGCKDSLILLSLPMLRRVSKLLSLPISASPTLSNYPPPHFGILVLRIPDTTSTADLVQEVLNALKALAGEDLKDSLFIIQPGRVRRRSSNS